MKVSSLMASNAFRNRAAWRSLFLVAFSYLFLFGFTCELSAAPAKKGFAKKENRLAKVAQLAQKSQSEKEFAKELAAVHGKPIRVKNKFGITELMAIRNGKAIYYSTENDEAAISTAANLVRDTAPYDVNGSGLVVGIWDAGSVMSTHREFGSRVSVKDGSVHNYHATHVGGTIGAAGITSSAQGMAPQVSIDSYDWNSDDSEMAARGMSYSGEADKIQVSNHSYGTSSGWSESGGEWTWYGLWGNRESDNFGQYDYDARTWDIVCYNAPFYLPFKSAGNDRNDNAPSSGTSFEYYSGGWQTKNFDSATDPYSDGFDSGFDTIPTYGCSKNVMTIGAVNDAASGGSRYLPGASMTSFSGYGPTDDGRIKPDIVANGSGLYSCDNDNTADYTTMSGTSMSSPNASGSAILLVDYYRQLNSGDCILASTLKGVIIHTADDLGNFGPDYKFGWGLMNTREAAEAIRENRIREGVLTSGMPSDNFGFYCDGTAPLKVTLCWTDPAASSKSGLDDSSPRLINDLDLRLISPDGFSVYEPFILDPANPNNTATTGDNVLDNVEQVYVASPAAGFYSVEISYKGSLTNAEQFFSIIIDGSFTTYPPIAMDAEIEISPNSAVTITLEATDDGEPNSLSGLDYIITSLPSHGELSDPNNGVIDSVPYILSNNASEVVYTPKNGCQLGVDFTFIADDGGVAPYGGESNEATVVVSFDLVITLLELETFDSGLPLGWSVSDGLADNKSWRGDNPKDRDISGSVTEPFMIVDSDWAGSVAMDEGLFSPVFDCNDVGDVILKFNHDFKKYGEEIADVDVRVGAGDWQNILKYQGDDASGAVEIDISAIADGQLGVQIRWHYYNANYEWWWAIDDVEVSGVAIAQNADGDLDSDCDVDVVDLDIFAADWLSACGICVADITENGFVDLADFSRFANNWLYDSQL